MKAVYRTDRGKVRTQNEDSVGVFYGEHQCLGVVADGMGGHAAGEVASRLALEHAGKRWEEVSARLSKEEAVDWLNRLVRSINDYLYRYSVEHEECRGMGTTIALVFFCEAFFAVSAVGDSRVYLWEKGQALRQVTEDHTLVNELVKSGELSKEAAEDHPKKHILTRALGTEPGIELDSEVVEWSEGSRVIICSDGLSNKLSDEKISEILEDGSPLHEKTEKMISLANEAGGEDNISMIIVSNESDGESR